MVELHAGVEHGDEHAGAVGLRPGLRGADRGGVGQRPLIGQHAGRLPRPRVAGAAIASAAPTQRPFQSVGEPFVHAEAIGWYRRLNLSGRPEIR